MTVGDFKKQLVERNVPDSCEICITTKECGSLAYYVEDKFGLSINGTDKNDFENSGLLLRAKGYEIK